GRSGGLLVTGAGQGGGVGEVFYTPRRGGGGGGGDEALRQSEDFTRQETARIQAEQARQEAQRIAEESRQLENQRMSALQQQQRSRTISGQIQNSKFLSPSQRALATTLYQNKPIQSLSKAEDIFVSSFTGNPIGTGL